MIQEYEIPNDHIINNSITSDSRVLMTISTQGLHKFVQKQFQNHNLNYFYKVLAIYQGTLVDESTRHGNIEVALTNYYFT